MLGADASQPRADLGDALLEPRDVELRGAAARWRARRGGGARRAAGVNNKVRTCESTVACEFSASICYLLVSGILTFSWQAVSDGFGRVSGAIIMFNKARDLVAVVDAKNNGHDIVSGSVKHYETHSSYY